MKGEIRTITYQQAKDFLLPKHYSGRIPSIMYAFGWYFKGELKAVVTYGKPASNTLCEGVCGKDYSKNVIELNRLCRTDDLIEQLSAFVSASLRRLRSYDAIVVSYSDTDMNHHGYIYQACNFIYTGMTKARTDKYTDGNKHSRHYNNENQNGLRKVRSAKHRYIFFCSTCNMLRKEWVSLLKYPICEYPKGDNSNYELGNFLQPNIIKDTKNDNR